MRLVFDDLSSTVAFWLDVADLTESDSSPCAGSACQFSLSA
jgi:hypothetical protein